MIPRGKIDISFSTLFTGLRYCASEMLGKQHNEIDEKQNELHCLSVRTGLSLALTALNFQPNTEILVMNINIPDLFSIISAHQLVAIPLSVNSSTLSMDLSQAEASLTKNTKAILLTHLFGGIMNLDEINAWAGKHNLVIIEDCAQAYNGIYKGHHASDMAMFSFGLIKSNTSLTGALLHFNNQQLYQLVLALNTQLPQQKTQQYLKKIFKGFLIKIVTTKYIFSLLYSISRLTARDFDDVLAGMTKGFPGADVMSKIRFRPCNANLKLMKKRLADFPQSNILIRKQIAIQILETVPDSMKIGDKNNDHTYWVLPVKSRPADHLIENLRKKGCDATAKASSLVKLRQKTKPAFPEELDLDNLVYLPIDRKTAPILKKLFTD